MKIETRYNIGDSVWFLFSNKVELGKVSAIKTFTTETASYDSYNIDLGDNKAANNIEKLFTTKDELLKTL